MQNKTTRAFGSFTKEGWQNFALLTLAVFYITQFSLDSLVWNIMCGNLGGDYCAYWSAAKIANTEGYVEIYNLDKLEQIQRPISPTSLPFGVRPFPYLPVFILPFQLLFFLGPFLGYWVWTIINLFVVILYLRYFSRNITYSMIDMRLLLIILLSWPFFTNLFFGQVNLWLTICLGEHLRAAITGKPFKAGLWLAGLLMKPHYLILIIPVLIFQRYGKVLVGFASSTVAIVAASFLMVGMDGFIAISGMWLGYRGAPSAVDPFIMMNWRMFGINLTGYLGPAISWTLAGTGMIVTFILFARLWIHPVQLGSPFYAVALLGTFAATTTLAWHSHIFYGTILIVPLVYLSLESNQLPRNILYTWVFVPPAINFAVYILAIFIRNSQVSINLGGILNLLNSGCQLAVNLYLLYWTTTLLRSGYTRSLTT